MSNPSYVKTNPERVWQRHMELSEIGKTVAGGVHRPALTDEDIAAHVKIAEWATARSFAVELDAMGNMFVCRTGSNPSAKPVASGSHTDSQPYAGRFDGPLGVLTAFEVLEALEDAGVPTKRPIEVPIWNNEEGARFMPGLSGSGAYTGVMDMDQMLDCVDDNGITMRSCVEKLHAALPDAKHRPLGQPYAGFVEAHIEQSTILEDAGEVIGVVTDIQGNRRFEVRVTGENAHSGTTPRSRRKDAFVAATDIAVALRNVFWDEEDIARFTIGKFEVLPGAKSIVPGEVNFFIDFRHPSKQVLKELGDQIEVVANQHAGPCTVSVNQVSRADPLKFSDIVTDLIVASANRHGFAFRRMISCAGHDARHFVSICPTAMVFIPCWKGISHNEQESAEPEHVAAAAQVIADVLVDMANWD